MWCYIRQSYMFLYCHQHPQDIFFPKCLFLVRGSWAIALTPFPSNMNYAGCYIYEYQISKSKYLYHTVLKARNSTSSCFQPHFKHIPLTPTQIVPTTADYSSSQMVSTLVQIVQKLTSGHANLKSKYPLAFLPLLVTVFHALQYYGIITLPSTGYKHKQWSILYALPTVP